MVHVCAMMAGLEMRVTRPPVSTSTIAADRVFATMDIVSVTVDTRGLIAALVLVRSTVESTGHADKLTANLFASVTRDGAEFSVRSEHARALARTRELARLVFANATPVSQGLTAP